MLSGALWGLVEETTTHELDVLGGGALLWFGQWTRGVAGAVLLTHGHLGAPRRVRTPADEARSCAEIQVMNSFVQLGVELSQLHKPRFVRVLQLRLSCVSTINMRHSK
mmetsp:Transcript_54048/g.126249  ORF Transcript_54048/g.126249 Transcript_54048/m.126249 type:complete len:108 (-) Transcript_54048:89-412(-)